MFLCRWTKGLDQIRLCFNFFCFDGFSTRISAVWSKIDDVLAATVLSSVLDWENHRNHFCLKKQSVAALNNKNTFLVFYSSDLNCPILGKESIFYPSIKNLSLPLNLKSHYSCSANDWFSLQKTHLFWRCLTLLHDEDSEWCGWKWCWYKPVCNDDLANGKFKLVWPCSVLTGVPFRGELHQICHVVWQNFRLVTAALTAC